MRVSIEVSLYPLNEEYIPVIIDFIHRVQTYEEIQVERSTTCTLLIGEFEQLMKILTAELRHSWEQHGRAVLVAKFLYGDVRKNP